MASPKTNGNFAPTTTQMESTCNPQDTKPNPHKDLNNNNKALQLALKIQTCDRWTELVDTCVHGFQSLYSAKEVRWMECLNKNPREIWHKSASPECHAFISTHFHNMFNAFSKLTSYYSKVVKFFYQKKDDILCLNEHCPEWELADSSFYRDYMTPLGIKNIICMQAYFSGSGGLVILAIGLPSREVQKFDLEVMKGLIAHLKVACKRISDTSSLNNLTATLGTLRQPDTAVGVTILGNDGSKIWEADPTSADLIKELGGVYNASGLNLPVKISTWVKQNIDSRMRVCAQTEGTTQTFKTWDAKEIEITLYLERAGRGVILILKQLAPQAHWDHDKSSASALHPAVKFTRRQLDVIRSLDSGMGTYEISDALNISKRTVDKHLEHIYAKLGVNNRVSALNRFHILQEQFRAQTQQKEDKKQSFNS